MFFKIFKNSVFFIAILATTIAPISQSYAVVESQSALASQSFLQGIESSVLVFSTHDAERFGGSEPAVGSAYQLIDEAQKSILVANYIFDDPTILNLLNRKAEEGVEVQVVADRVRCAGLGSKLHPSIKFGTHQYAEGHMHHKFLVADYCLVWISGANFFNFQGVPNISVAFYSEKTAAALHEEASHIVNNSPRSKAVLPSEKIGEQDLEVYILPHNDLLRPLSVETAMNEAGRKKTLSLIDNAKDHIEISMVVWTYKDVARALANAVKRGVKVKVTGALMDLEVRRLLASAGISIKDINGHYHHKYMVIDHEILWNGSANFSLNAFSRSDESFVVLYDLTPEQQVVMDGAWTDLLMR